MIELADKYTLQTFVKRAVSGQVSLIATDEWAGYGNVNKAFPKRPHKRVNHAKKEYARRNVHTGNIDSFWSLIKCGVMETFHQVSKEYLPLYLAEFSFRHNNRKNADIFTQVVAGC